MMVNTKRGTFDNEGQCFPGRHTTASSESVHTLIDVKGSEVEIDSSWDNVL